MVAEGKLGSDQSGTFAKLDDIIEEFGDKHTVKSIIDYLEASNYIRKINDKFEKLHNNKLDYKAYQVTEHGRTRLAKNQGIAQPINYHQNNFGDVYGSNISIDSQYVSQIIEKQDDETKELLKELLEATEKKDKPAILKVLGYIADKSLDLLIAIIAGGVRL
jgi:DNA-binding PadR family transcriptional regulator